MSVYIGEVETFPGVRPDKAQALKVLEEAAEVFGAWQHWHDSPASGEWAEGVRLARIEDECADVIQAVCNLLAAFGCGDFKLSMDACARRNRERGRM